MAGHERGLTVERRYIGTGGWPFNFGPARYADGSVGTPPAPTPPPGNPFIDPATGERYPGAPGA